MHLWMEMMRPRISFSDKNIWLRLQACVTVAQAHGWHPNDIINFTTEVQEAFSYEEAMAIIEREFDISPVPSRLGAGALRNHG